MLGTAHPLVPWAADVGLVQPDSLREDDAATLNALDDRCGDAAIDELAAQLSAYHGVVVDIAPAALEAARRAGVPAVAMGNFDWAWIYGHYERLRPWAQRFAAWQGAHPAIQLRPGPDLTGFASVTQGGLLARRFAPMRAVGRTQTAILVGFGGFGLPALGELLPVIDGVVWLFAAPMVAPARPDCRFVGEVPFSALLAGADLVLTKPGYGMLAEAMLSGARLLYFDRGGFPEAPYLEAAMRERGDVKVGARPGVEGDAAVREALHEAVAATLSGPRPRPLLCDDAEVIVVAVMAALRG